MLKGMLGRNGPSKMSTSLSVTLHGKRDLADEIKVKDLEMKKLPWII